jgi:uncharacterized membrane protein required for colicin V production
MTGTGPAVFAAAGALQPFGTLLVLAIVAGMAAFGFLYGFFLAILAGLGAIATLLVAFGLGEAVASLLVAVEMPADYALPVSIGVLAVAGALSVRFAIGGAVGEGTLRFSPLVDKIGGVLIGGLAGVVIAGTLLVLLSAMPIPAAYSIDGTQTKYDLGTRVLKTFASLIEGDAAAREVLLDGEAPAGEAAGGPETSELFVDINGNGLFDGEGEAAEGYLDQDGNGSFTPRVSFTDTNGNGVRDIGLLERYRLRAWQKLRVMHYPTITSDGTSILAAILGDGQEVYKAVVTDLDPDDQITFSLRDPTATAETGTVSEGTAEVEAAADGDPAADAAAASTTGPAAYEDPLFAIDPTAGSVTVKDAKAFMRRTEPSQIIVVATDKRGLSSEKTVSLIYRGVVPGQ